MRNLFFPKLCKISKREPCLRDQMAGDAALPGAGDAECAWGWDVQATPPGKLGSFALGGDHPGSWSHPYGPVLILRDRPVIENVMLTSGLVCFLVTSLLVREIDEYL